MDQGSSWLLRQRSASPATDRYLQELHPPPTSELYQFVSYAHSPYVNLRFHIHFDRCLTGPRPCRLAIEPSLTACLLKLSLAKTCLRLSIRDSRLLGTRPIHLTLTVRSRTEEVCIRQEVQEQGLGSERGIRQARLIAREDGGSGGWPAAAYLEIHTVSALSCACYDAVNAACQLSWTRVTSQHTASNQR